MKTIFVLCLILFSLGFWGGYNYEITVEFDVMSPEWAINRLEQAKESHQFYIDHPELQSKHTGNTTRNESIIDDYSKIQELIKEFLYEW